MNRPLTYNYYCINDDCDTKNIHIRKCSSEESRIELCEQCKQELKQLGIATNIAHKGTQEAMNKMHR